MINKVTWKIIPSFPLFEASNRGEIRRIGNEKTLAPFIGNRGYSVVNICGEGKCKHPTVHRLVAEAFLGKRPNKICVCHLDGTRTNNVLENLKYGTYKENEAHKIIHGTRRLGESNHQHRLSEKTVMHLRHLKKHGKLTNVMELANKYGVHNTTIYRAAKKQLWSYL